MPLPHLLKTSLFSPAKGGKPANQARADQGVCPVPTSPSLAPRRLGERAIDLLTAAVLFPRRHVMPCIVPRDAPCLSCGMARPFPVLLGTYWEIIIHAHLPTAVVHHHPFQLGNNYPTRVDPFQALRHLTISV